MINPAYSLCSAGGMAFVRPLELLVRMSSERQAFSHQLEQWVGQQASLHGYNAQVLSSLDAHVAQQTESAGPNRYWPKLWQSGWIANYPLDGHWTRHSQYMDWHLDRYYGGHLDCLLSWLPASLNHNLRHRFVPSLELDGEESFTRLEPTEVPQLSQDEHFADEASAHIDNDSQLITRNLRAPGTEHSLRTAGRLAQPICGQGMINQIRVTVEDPIWQGGTNTWREQLSEMAQPSVSGNRGMPYVIRIYSDVDNAPGVDLGPVAAATRYVQGVNGYQPPDDDSNTAVFKFLRPVETRCDKFYWLVLESLGEPDELNTDFFRPVVNTETNPDAPDRVLMLDTGEGWEAHPTATALACSLHMPKFLWRAKPTWVALSEMTKAVIEPSVMFAEDRHYTWGDADQFNWEAVATCSGARASAHAHAGTHSNNQWVTPVIAAQLAQPTPSTQAIKFENTAKGEDGSQDPIRTYFGASFGSYNYQPKYLKLQRWKAFGQPARIEFTVSVAELAGNNGGVPTVGTYVVDEIITLNGGVPAGERCQIRITEVDENDLMVAFDIEHPGSYYRMDHPLHGAIGSYKDGDREFLLVPKMQVQDVEIIDTGNGYRSDCAFTLEPDTIVNNPNDVEVFARVRGIMVDGQITSVAIQARGLGYPSGGCGYSSYRVDPASQDPSLNQAWPGVWYELDGGNEFSMTQGNNYITCDGVDYVAGDSFVGNGAAFTNQVWLAEGNITSGIPFSCFQVVGMTPKHPEYVKYITGTANLLLQVDGRGYVQNAGSSDPIEYDRVDFTGHASPTTEDPPVLRPFGTLVHQTDWVSGANIGGIGSEFLRPCPGAVNDSQYAEYFLKRIVVTTPFIPFGRGPGGGAGGSENSNTAYSLRADVPITDPPYGCAETVHEELQLPEDFDGPKTVWLRVRGVLEGKLHTGGTAEGAFYRGGTPSSNDANVVRLTVGSDVYYLNHNLGNLAAVDYEVQVVLNNGDLIQLDYLSSDGQEYDNYLDLTVPGIDPYPAPFDGQFVRIDFEL